MGESDSDLVAGVLRDLDAAAHHWAALLADAESATFSVDAGDIHAVADADGRLVDLRLHPGITHSHTHGELAARLNAVFAALRTAVQAHLVEVVRSISECP